MPNSPESPIIDHSSLDSKKTSSHAVSRRNFLKLAATGSLLTLTGQQVAKQHEREKTHGVSEPTSQSNETTQTQPTEETDKTIPQAREQQKQEKIKFHQDLIHEIALHPEYNYWETLKEQGLMIIAKTLTSHVFEQLGIPHGNANVPMETVLERIKSVSLETALANTLVNPIAEELMTRLIPSVFLAGQGGARWDVGVPVAALFAFGHSFSKAEAFGMNQMKLTDTIPITQFMGGLFYWHLMREKGIDHAILAHITNNTVMFGVGKLLYELYPPAGEGFVKFTHGKMPSKEQTEGDSYD